jgi:hypothetical protein
VCVNLQATLSVFENGFNLFSRNAGKPGEKVIHARAAFEILEERLHRHSSPTKNPLATNFVWIALDD